MIDKQVMFEFAIFASIIFKPVNYEVSIEQSCAEVQENRFLDT